MKYVILYVTVDDGDLKEFINEFSPGPLAENYNICGVTDAITSRRLDDDGTRRQMTWTEVTTTSDEDITATVNP